MMPTQGIHAEALFAPRSFAASLANKQKESAKCARYSVFDSRQTGKINKFMLVQPAMV